MSYNKASCALRDSLKCLNLGYISYSLDKVGYNFDGTLNLKNGKVNVLHSPKQEFRWRAIADQIDKLHITGGHSQVKDNSIWKKLYQVDKRQVSYFNKNNTIVNKLEDVMPCHNCGVILPTQMIQVDHQQPQKNFSDYYFIKILRSMGLTVTGPTGAKGKLFLASPSPTVLPPLPPRGRDTGDVTYLKGTTSFNKWRLNPEGVEFVSVLNLHANALESVKTLCRDSILNLVPLCAPCNGNKSGLTKGYTL